MSTNPIAAVAAALRMVGAEGVAVGLTTGDTAVFCSVGGIDGELLSEQTVMYGASLAKQVVGLLLAQAVDTGRISAADRLITWLPELPDWMGEIRLHHLLHHTSGLPDVTAPAQGIKSRQRRTEHQPARHHTGRTHDFGPDPVAGW